MKYFLTKVVPTGGSPDGSESAGDSESILYPEEEDDFSDLDHEDELPPVNKKKMPPVGASLFCFKQKNPLRLGCFRFVEWNGRVLVLVLHI